jgi:hypothetical protein
MNKNIGTYIAAGEIKQAFDLAQKLSSDNKILKRQVIILLSQWNSLNKEKHQGVLSNEEFSRDRNRIEKGLLSISTKLSE